MITFNDFYKKNFLIIDIWIFEYLISKINLKFDKIHVFE